MTEYKIETLPLKTINSKLISFEIHTVDLHSTMDGVPISRPATNHLSRNIKEINFKIDDASFG